MYTNYDVAMGPVMPSAVVTAVEFLQIKHLLQWLRMVYTKMVLHSSVYGFSKGLYK